MQFRIISLFNKKWFVKGVEIDILKSIASKPISIKQPYSNIIFWDKYGLKVIKAQKGADFFRRYFNSQGLREYYSSKKLSQLKIKTPKVYLYGVQCNILNNYDSLLLMEYLPFLTLEELLKKNEIKENVFSNLLKDINKFINNGYIHKDANLNNILVNDKDELFWIDNDIREIKSKRDIEIFLRKITNSNHLNKDSKKQILSLKK